MEIKLTKNQIKDTHDIIVRVGYCRLYYTLNRSERLGYMSGIYGWNADVYSFRHKGHRIAIVTGYRTDGFGKGKEVVSLPSAFEERIEKATEKLAREWSSSKARDKNLTRVLDEAIRVYETPVSKRRD